MSRMVGRGEAGGGVCEGLCGIEGALASTGDGGLAGWVVVWPDGWLDGLVRMGRSVRKESASARTTAPVTAARCMGETRVDLAAGARSLQIACRWDGS